VSVHDAKMLPLVSGALESVGRGGNCFEMEFPLRGADGVYRWFLSRIRPVRDEAGNITRWYGTATNVDEQRQLLQSLSEAREDLEKRVEERTAELRTATESLRDLSARLLRMRDDEQRRLARELHDSVGQVAGGDRDEPCGDIVGASRLTPGAAKCVGRKRRIGGRGEPRDSDDLASAASAAARRGRAGVGFAVVYRRVREAQPDRGGT